MMNKYVKGRYNQFKRDVAGECKFARRAGNSEETDGCTSETSVRSPERSGTNVNVELLQRFDMSSYILLFIVVFVPG
jgi:hypothetical protein